MERASVCEISARLIVAACANFVDNSYTVPVSRYMLTCLVRVHTRAAGAFGHTPEWHNTALTQAAQVMSTCIVVESMELGAASLPRCVIHFLHNLVSLFVCIGAGSFHQKDMVELGSRSPG